MTASAPNSADAAWLVGDVGATNARFGLASPEGAILHSSTFACAGFSTLMYGPGSGPSIPAYRAPSPTPSSS